MKKVAPSIASFVPITAAWDDRFKSFRKIAISVDTQSQMRTTEISSPSDGNFVEINKMPFFFVSWRMYSNNLLRVAAARLLMTTADPCRMRHYGQNLLSHA